MKKWYLMLLLILLKKKMYRNLRELLLEVLVCRLSASFYIKKAEYNVPYKMTRIPEIIITRKLRVQVIHTFSLNRFL